MKCKHQKMYHSPNDNKSHVAYKQDKMVKTRSKKKTSVGKVY